ncbi:MAG: hypothetical protein PHX77_08060 [Candidatus Bipolaricaulis sp.]|nr:hypothetical protein [Candidatus Bipolaricaulis sp.]MDD5645770.1 hypothetical protein [Candidatus Bipolaricaulis sp.]
MATSSQTVTVPYKFLVRGLFCVFIGLVVARILVPFVVAASAEISELVRDLWSCAQSILAALLGLLAGKASA